jgi:MFS family permease
MKIKNPLVILALFTGLNLLNYLDRFVLAAVIDPIQKELGISNAWAGALAPVFIVGYVLTSPIFGWLADRGSRKGLIAIGVLVWSVGTFGTGLAHTLPMLLLMRVIVGVGEASYATIAPTIIDDLAPPAQKSRWLAIFYVATPIGSALGYVVGGQLESLWGWRSAFLVCGGPGIILAILCLFIVEPERKKLSEKANLVEDVKHLVKAPSYVHAVLGYAAYTFAVGGFAFWAPTFLIRTFNLSLKFSTRYFGIVTVLGGTVGTALGGWISDHMAAKRGGDDKAVVRAGLWVCAIGSFVGAPLAVACFLAPSATAFFAFAFFCDIALFLNSSPINAVILRAVPEERRAGAMAVSIMTIHLLGDLWSPPMVGKLIDTFPMRLALMILPVAALVSGAILLPPRRRKRVEGATT